MQPEEWLLNDDHAGEMDWLAVHDFPDVAVSGSPPIARPAVSVAGFIELEVISIERHGAIIAMRQALEECNKRNGYE